jgi:hypothetical protein
MLDLLVEFFALVAHSGSAFACNLQSTLAAAYKTANRRVCTMGLDKGRRRDVQRRLTGLGFNTKVNGRFDESTRAVITRWQAARGYPKTGFLNALQHEALLTESVSGAHASLGGSDKSDDDRPARRRGGGGAHHHRSGGGPGGLVGGVVGGLFGRR